MKTHPRIGYDILKGSPSKYLSMGAIIALGHHEKYDGSGYPNGLHGEDIPLVARVVAVADVFDALVSERPYKHAWPLAEGIDFLKCAARRAFRSALHRRVPGRSRADRVGPCRVRRLAHRRKTRPQVRWLTRSSASHVFRRELKVAGASGRPFAARE